MFKKTCSIFLSAALLGACACMTGCNPGTNESGGEDDLITLQVYSQLANWNGMQTGFFETLMEDKFGVKLNIIPDADGTFATRMEKGNLGDIVLWGNNGVNYTTAIADNMLFDWEDEDLLTKHGPYIKEHFNDALEANREINGDNKIYGIGHGIAGNNNDHQSFFYTWDVRWDLYKQLGYPIINDLDDYVQLMKDMKEICPTDDNGKSTYAASLWPDWDENLVMYVKSFASAYYGYDEMDMGLYDTENGIYHDALETNGPYLTALKFFNKLYQAGLIDPDSSTQTYDQMSSKVQNGGTFFSIFNYSGSTAYNSVDHVNAGKMMCSLVPNDAKVISYGLSTKGGTRIWSIGSKTQYPEKCMEIINYLATPEGAMSIWYGLKGVHWDYDENKNIKFTDFGRQCYFEPSKLQTGTTWTSPDTGKTYDLTGTFNDGKLQVNNIVWDFDAINPDSNNERFNYQFWKSEQAAASSDIEQDWRTKTGFNDTQSYIESKNYSVIPGVSFGEGTRDAELSLKWNNVRNAIVQLSWQAMYADSDSKFNSLINQMTIQCKGYGYNDCVTWSKEETQRKFGNLNN